MYLINMHTLRLTIIDIKGMELSFSKMASDAATILFGERGKGRDNNFMLVGGIHGD